MEEYKISINSKNEKKVIGRDEMEFIHLKFEYHSCMSINDISDYGTDSISSY